MSNSLPNTPVASSNPVSSVTVTDISDCMPMCHENIPMMDMDDLVIPQEEPVSTSGAKSDIIDSMDVVYQNILRSLSQIIHSMQTMEVSYDCKG